MNRPAPGAFVRRSGPRRGAEATMILLLLLVLLFAGLALWIRLRGGPGAPRRPEAEREAAALRARYARGEIDSAEFNARLRALDARRRR